jgi:hypothetical protein
MPSSLNSFNEASLAMDDWSRPSSAFAYPTTSNRLSTLRPLLSMMTPLKMGLGAAAVASLLLTVAIQKIPRAERIEIAKPTIKEAQFDAAWADNFQTAVAKKQDRIRQIEITRVSTEPVPVTTERVRPDPAPAVPALVALPQDAEGENGPEPKYSKRHRVASAESNVCTRHHLRKIVTRGGRSWRCGR